ncbi:MAG: radical SAM protein [Odoribacter sp.]|nr:radical SAM protein [Odoribacter sp.]
MKQLHFTGPIWRPPYESNSVLIQATAGCTHNKCKFCSLYPKDLKFRMSPLDEFESDLLTLKEYGITGGRIFLTGSNPFVINYNRLYAIAEKIKKYIPYYTSIGCFSRITDIATKSVSQLKELRRMGYNGLIIGIETGDDKTLEFMRKGYTAQEALKQCRKLEEANIAYDFIILNGLAGEGNGRRNAEESAKLYNQLHPSIINITSLTIFPESDLYLDMKKGLYVETPELERLEEMSILIEGLQNPVTILANTISNTIPLTGVLPKDKSMMISRLKAAMNLIEEKDLNNYRKSIGSL